RETVLRTVSGPKLSLNPDDFFDLWDVTNRAYDLREVVTAVDLQGEVQQGRGADVVLHGEVDDVGVGLGDFRRESAEYTASVERGDVQPGGEVAGGAVVPGDRHPAFGFAGALTLCDRALRHVYDQAVAQAYTANNGVARQRAATGGQLYRLTFIAVDQNWG